jgi:hypothetical protein
MAFPNRLATRFQEITATTKSEIVVESGKAEAAKSESDLFYNAFKASPIGIALEDMEGRPPFRGSSPLLDAWTQRGGNAQQTLCRILFPRKGLVSFEQL